MYYDYLDKMIEDDPNTNKPRFVRGSYNNLIELTSELEQQLMK